MSYVKRTTSEGRIRDTGVRQCHQGEQSPANLAAEVTQSKADAQLPKIILEGRPGTAISSYDGAFDEAQLTDLIAYIRSFKP